MTEPPVNQPKHTISPALLVFLSLPLLGMIAAVALLFANAAASQNPAAITPPPVSVTFPAVPTPRAMADSPVIPFTLTSLDGETISLSDYEGKIVFLNFWATWCEPCKRELPTFEAFSEANAGGDALILAVNVEETPDEVSAFLAEMGVDDLPVLLDPEGETATEYGIFNLPTTFVIDQNGIVRYPKYGEVTEADLAAYLEALMPAANG